MYYAGSAEEWNEITVADGNEDFLSSTIYYYSELEPTSEGYYWHYDENGNIEELIRDHSYTTVVTPPTCTTEGYTTYTCSCGDTYIDDYVEAFGEHEYASGICKICGDAKGSKGLSYLINDDSISCTVTGMGSCDDAQVHVPVSIDGYKVTAIGQEAFFGQQTLTKIVLPESLTFIGARAFDNCENLLFNEHDNAYYLASETNDFFALIKDKGSIVCGVKDQTKIIASNAFWSNTGLHTITFGSKLEIICKEAFYCCGELQNVNFPDSLTYIGDSAFYFCYGLTTVTIPENVTYIGTDAFGSCCKLSEVINKSSLNIVKGGRDFGCVAFSALEVKKEGVSAIVNDNGLLFYSCDTGNYLIDYLGKETNLVLPDNYGGESYVINQSSLYHRYGFTSIVIPKAVTAIGQMAFYNIGSIKKVYYAGTLEEWNKISVADYNDELYSSTIFYYSELEPTEGGNYWRYDENGNAVEW